MSHDSCVTTRNKLTAAEESNFANWFVKAATEHPENFTFAAERVVCKGRGISIYVAGGPNYVRIIEPEASANFGFLAGRQIFEKAHELRHLSGSDYSRKIAKAVAEQNAAAPQNNAAAQANYAAPQAEADSGLNIEARTEPEVAKLRELVNKVKVPAMVGLAIVVAFGASAAVALAG